MKHVSCKFQPLYFKVFALLGSDIIERKTSDLMIRHKMRQGLRARRQTNRNLFFDCSSMCFAQFGGDLLPTNKRTSVSYKRIWPQESGLFKVLWALIGIFWIFVETGVTCPRVPCEFRKLGPCLEYCIEPSSPKEHKQSSSCSNNLLNLFAVLYLLTWPS